MLRAELESLLDAVRTGTAADVSACLSRQGAIIDRWTERTVNSFCSFATLRQTVFDFWSCHRLGPLEANALHLAVHRNDLDVVKCIIESKASTNVQVCTLDRSR